MKIVIFGKANTYFATVVEDNGDEFELTRGNDLDALLDDIRNQCGADVEIKYHESAVK